MNKVICNRILSIIYEDDLPRIINELDYLLKELNKKHLCLNHFLDSYIQDNKYDITELKDGLNISIKLSDKFKEFNSIITKRSL